MFVSSQDILTYLQAFQGITVSQQGQKFINMVQPIIEVQIQKIIGSDVLMRTYTEYYPESEANTWTDGEELVIGYDIMGGVAMPRNIGDRSLATLRLRNTPVRSIASIYENPGAHGLNPPAWPDATLLPNNVYYLDSPDGDLCWTGKVYRQLGLWATTPRCIKVTYTAGLSSGEIDANFPGIKMAVMIWIAKEYISAEMRGKFAQLGGIQSSVSIEGFSTASMNPNTIGAGGFNNPAIPPEAAQWISQYISISRYFG